jgi:CDP-paratose 2-epimerase
LSVAIITGSAGLVGSEAVRYFASLGMQVVGIENDMRSCFFGQDASTAWQNEELKREIPCYQHETADVRDESAIRKIFERYQGDICLIIHTAAQPSHDWAATQPVIDFAINANGTLMLLEATRTFAPDAPFIFTSTNKVYGDRPNFLPLIEHEKRWDIDPAHPCIRGIPEQFSIDHSLHSPFGASKLAADLLVQEYGKYFGMKTVCFRCGCLTGPRHSGTRLHGFLAYLMRCASSGTPYTVFGYKGKQVRDNLHSLDLIRAFDEFFKSPRCGEVYNMGGGSFSNCSVLEAIELSEMITNREMKWSYVPEHRKGDHVWYISDVSKFQSHFPEWQVAHTVPDILREICDQNVERWKCQLAGIS